MVGAAVCLVSFHCSSSSDILFVGVYTSRYLVDIKVTVLSHVIENPIQRQVQSHKSMVRVNSRQCHCASLHFTVYFNCNCITHK